MKNSELLAYKGSQELLSQIEQQALYVLRMESTPMKCPSCAHMSRTWEAAGVSVDDYTLTTYHAYHCPQCGIKLAHQIGLFGGQRWWEKVD